MTTRTKSPELELASTTIKQFKDTFFYRAIFAEFFATTLFLYFVTTVQINLSPETGGGPTIVQVAFTFGLTITCLVQVFGPVSGAHMNPAVTLASVFMGSTDIVKGFLYIVAQVAGAAAGSGLTCVLTPVSKRGSLGAVYVSHITYGQAFVVELLLTTILIFTVLASTDEKREEHLVPPALAIGLAVTVAHLAGIPYTHCGINPARAIGPAIVTRNFHHHHWVYWAGPFASSCMVAFFYKFIFGVEEPSTIPSAKESIEDMFAMPMRAHRTGIEGTRAVSYIHKE